MLWSIVGTNIAINRYGSIENISNIEVQKWFKEMHDQNI